MTAITLAKKTDIVLAPTAVKTSAYAAAANDFVPVDTTAANVTVTLPSAPADGTRVGVKMVAQASAHVVTIACGGTDVFNKAAGSTTLSLPLLNQGVILQYKVSSGIWYVLSDDLALSQLDARYVSGAVPVTIIEGSATGSWLKFMKPDGVTTAVEWQNIATGGAVAPALKITGTNGAWQTCAIDVAAVTPDRDLVLAVKMDYPAAGNANDFVYVSHGGTKDPTIGFGKSQPGDASARYRAWIVGWTITSEPAMGTLRLQGGSGQTGSVLTFTDWGGRDHALTDPSNSDTWNLKLLGDTATSNPILTVADITTPTTIKLELLANGTIRFGGATNNYFEDGANNTIKAHQNLWAGNFLGVGGGVNSASFGADIDVVKTSTSDASLRLRTASNGNLVIKSAGASATCSIVTQNASTLTLGTNGVTAVTVTTSQSVVLGKASIATNATDGFPYIPAAAGAPSGTPTTQTGFAPIYYDTTNHKLWIYDAGWKGVVVA